MDTGAITRARGRVNVFKEALAEAEADLREAELAGVGVGDVVSITAGRHAGQMFRVTHVGERSPTGLSGNPQRLDGTWRERVRTIHGPWVVTSSEAK